MHRVAWRAQLLVLSRASLFVSVRLPLLGAAARPGSRGQTGVFTQCRRVLSAAVRVGARPLLMIIMQRRVLCPTARARGAAGEYGEYEGGRDETSDGRAACALRRGLRLKIARRPLGRCRAATAFSAATLSHGVRCAARQETT